MDAIRRTAGGYGEGKEPDKGTFLAMRVSATKNKVLKDDYFACQIFRDLGLSNIAQGGGALDELNVEAILQADPDYIFVVTQGKDDEAMESYREQFETNGAWKELSAVENGRLYFLPKEYFQYKPNAAWVKAYEYAAELME